jgi:hypothetical protein
MELKNIKLKIYEYTRECHNLKLGRNVCLLNNAARSENAAFH